MDSATRPYGGSCWEAPFTGGVTIYAFYAMQPYLLELYGNQRAFAIAGLDTVDALSLARRRESADSDLVEGSPPR